MREKINLQELTTLLSDKAGISKKEADVFLREFFGLMTDALIEDKQVKIKNLGTFKLVEVGDRESVNVRTGERVLIPAHTKVSYNPDKELSEIINNPCEELEAKNLPEPNEPEPEIEKIEAEIKPEIEAEEVEEIEEELAEESSVNEIDDDESDMVINARKKHVRIVFFTFFTVAILLVGIYFYSRENNEMLSSYYTPPPARTAFDLAQEKEESENADSVFGETGEEINPADTVMPVKQAWLPVKKRKTKVGERLTLISFEEYGDVVFWIYIYDENKHLITKDNYVKAGVDIIIPPPEKYDIDAKDPKSLQKARDFAKNYNKDDQK